MTQANENNFYILTRAKFKRQAQPTRKPDYVSTSGSKYWYTEKGVIRTSDHWIGVNTCEWEHPDDDGIRTGFCRWVDFEHIANDVTIYVKHPEVFDKWEYEGKESFRGISYFTIQTSFENCHDGQVWFYGRSCTPSSRYMMAINFDY